MNKPKDTSEVSNALQIARMLLEERLPPVQNVSIPILIDGVEVHRSVIQLRISEKIQNQQA